MEMEEDIPGMKSLLRSLAEEAQAQSGAHLDSETLVAYYLKHLPADESSRAQDHLVNCRECTALLLDLDQLCAPEEAEPSQSSRAESEAEWARLQSLFRTEPQMSLSLFQRLRELIFPPRPVYALAALSLALSLSLAAWIVSLKQENRGLITQLSQEQIARDARSAREIEEAQRQRDEARARAEQLRAQLTRPQLNVQIIDLPLGRTRALGDSRLEEIELLANDTRFDLILPPPEQNYPDYAIEILDQRGAMVVNERGLRPDKKAGVFTISLPRALLPPGEYRFNVYGIGRGERTRVSGGVARIRYKQ